VIVDVVVVEIIDGDGIEEVMRLAAMDEIMSQARYHEGGWRESENFETPGIPCRRSHARDFWLT
jgi:hypothetical protein